MDNLYILPRAERERLKSEADRKTLSGAFDVIYALYERSREAWHSVKRRKKQHPSYEEYARAFAANPHSIYLFGKDVVEELRQRYPGKPSRHLPNGASYWYYDLKKAQGFVDYWKGYV
jgi:hypothetical protein